MTFNGEQVVYGSMHTPDEIELMQLEITKYNWALPHCSMKAVVDLGCGTGFGTLMLSLVSQAIVGYDKNEEAIKHAQETHWGRDLQFKVMDFDKEVPDNHLVGWDVAVCFECLEHLSNPDYLLSHLNADRLICSIPIGAGKNGFHLQDFPNDSDAIELLTRNGWKVTHSERLNRPNGTGSLMMICER